MKSFKQFIKEMVTAGYKKKKDDPFNLRPWDDPIIPLPDPSKPWYIRPVPKPGDPDFPEDDEEWDPTMDNPWYSPEYFDPDRPQWYKPIDLPEPPDGWQWDHDSDGDGIPDYRDPDPFDPTNPSWDMPYGKPFDPNNPFPDGRPYVPPFIASAPKNTGIIPK